MSGGGARLGCAKDTWALMTRAAADVYFNASQLGALRSSLWASSLLWPRCFSHMSECLLGCALHQGGVEIRTVALRRVMIRSVGLNLSHVGSPESCHSRPRPCGRQFLPPDVATIALTYNQST